jgi:hypothetical protein
MENKITQRLDFCKISIFKNYSNYPRIQTYKTLFNTPINESNSFIVLKNNNNKNYFSSNENVYVKLTQKGETFYTDKERHIKYHYNRPFSEIENFIYERSIEENDNFVRIKYFYQSRTRGVNSKFFRKSYFKMAISFNLKTGNFIIFKSSKSGKRKSSQTIIQNSFYNLFNELTRICTIPDLTQYNIKVNKIENKPIDSFLKKFKEVMQLRESKNFDELNFSLMEWFVTKKKIKVPNDYYYLLKFYYPTEVFLKKNDRKLINSILDKFAIKSKVTNKIVHDLPNINLYLLKYFCKLFGENFSKYIGNLPISCFPIIDNINTIGICNDYPMIINTLLNDEKENLLSLITSYGTMSYSLIQLLIDHFYMMDRLRYYYPDIRLNAKTTTEFNDEHAEFSKLISIINKGWVYEYKYNEKMVNDVELPITVNIEISSEQTEQITFYPYILKRDDEYNEEGTFMHHCVASYVNKSKSIIISIRTFDAKDRVTCEFDGQTGKCIQARHFCNRVPPEDMLIALDTLKIKTSYYAQRGLLHSIQQVKTPIKINGIEVNKEKQKIYLNEELFN